MKSALNYHQRHVKSTLTMSGIFVINVLLTIMYGLTNADEVPKISIKHLEPDKGTEGYDLFFYDGQSLRDEKWRFDRNTGSTMISRRNGFRDLDNFHLVDATLDALGSFTTSYQMQNEKEFIKNRVKEPQMSKDTENILKQSLSGSNTFTGVSINTQYSSLSGYPQLSNVVGIQHQNNIQNPLNGLNFHQSFTTPQFGFQQQGSLFNQQGQFSNQPNFPHNPNFQFSSFIMPFYNHNSKPNQQQTFGSNPSFGVPGIEQGYLPIDPQAPVTNQPTISSTSQIPDSSQNYFPNIPFVTPEHHSSSTTESSVDKTTTIDPTLGFDIRRDEDINDSNDDNLTLKIQTTTRRTIEGLPTSDEDNEDGGVLDDKIAPQVLKTLVG